MQDLVKGQVTRVKMSIFVLVFTNRALRADKFAWLATLVCLLLPGQVPAQEIPLVKFTVDRFEVSGENPLSDEETQAILEPFIGDHVGLEGLLTAAETLQEAIQESGTPFTRVILPRQTLQEGVVQLEVIALTVSKVHVSGAEHHSEENIRRSVPDLEEGQQPPTQSRVDRRAGPRGLRGHHLQSARDRAGARRGG